MRSQLEMFTGTSAAVLAAGYGSAVHVGGVSALIHYGLTTNLSFQLHLFCNDLRLAADLVKTGELEDVVVNAVVKTDARQLIDGLGLFQCGGRDVVVSTAERAAAEAIAEQDYFDEDAKREMLKSYRARGYSISELLRHADRLGAGAEARRLLSAR